MLAAATTTTLTQVHRPQGLAENLKDGQTSMVVEAGNARREIEEKAGKPVITRQNAVDFAKLLTDSNC